jgi:hypothetical protein
LEVLDVKYVGLSKMDKKIKMVKLIEEKRNTEIYKQTFSDIERKFNNLVKNYNNLIDKLDYISPDHKFEV